MGISYFDGVWPLDGIHFHIVGIRAAEYESRLESVLVGVDRFGQNRSWNLQNFAESDSGPKSQTHIRQQIIIGDEQLCTLPKT